MAEFRLQALSPFAGLLKPGRYGAHLNPAGVTLRERAGLALFVISVGAGKASEAAAKVVAVTGLELRVSRASPPSSISLTARHCYASPVRERAIPSPRAARSIFIRGLSRREAQARRPSR